jgi:hypothetical protein
VEGFKIRPLYRKRKKKPWCPLDRRLGGPQNRSGQHEEKILDPTGIQTPRCCNIYKTNVEIQRFYITVGVLVAYNFQIGNSKIKVLMEYESVTQKLYFPKLY